MFLVLRTGQYGTGSALRGSAGATRGSLDVAVEGLPPDYVPGTVLPGRVHLQASAPVRTGGGYARLTYDPAPTADGADHLIALVLHDGDAGSWHGAGVPEIEASCAVEYGFRPCGERAADHVRGGLADGHAFQPGRRRVWITPHPGAVWLAASGSGAADLVAGIWRLDPTSPALAVKTSGYRGRGGWTITTVQPDGSVAVRTLAQYFATTAPAVAL